MEMENQRLQPVLVAFLVVLVLGGVTDLVLDRPTTWASVHVLFEVAFVLVSAVFAIVLWTGWRRTTERLQVTETALQARDAERETWRANSQKALEGMAHAIDSQFAAWSLTPTEREVALALLKGLGHKEIAARTGRSERTVRQHAVTVYQKAGLAGRAELAAFFLQDLMLPAESEGQDSA
jgi:DNA-binding CsgD family transcriptional regulator